MQVGWAMVVLKNCREKAPTPHNRLQAARMTEARMMPMLQERSDRANKQECNIITDLCGALHVQMEAGAALRQLKDPHCRGASAVAAAQQAP